jgi:hypothetical protein
MHRHCVRRGLVAVRWAPVAGWWRISFLLARGSVLFVGVPALAGVSGESRLHPALSFGERSGVSPPVSITRTIVVPFAVPAQHFGRWFHTLSSAQHALPPGARPAWPLKPRVAAAAGWPASRTAARRSVNRERFRPPRGG